jgi:hypothetical protein
VILLPVDQNGGTQETWQVNLKVPTEDDPGTPANEAETSKNYAMLELEFVPGKPLKLEIADTGDTTTTGATTGTGGTTVGGTSGTPSLGSTDLTGASGGIPGTGTGTTPVTAPPVPAGLTPASDAEPRLPAYVWLAVPLGLLALSAVRSVVLEPAGGPRPDGVIAAIRRRNAERRGAARQVGGAFSRLTGAFRRGATRPGQAASKLAKSVRRK